MTSTVFVDLVGPPVNAAWLNDVNLLAYLKTFPDGKHVLTTESAAAPTGSSLVGFQLSATGAAVQTLFTKSSQTVSVTDFYANGVSGVMCGDASLPDCTLGFTAAQGSGNVTVLMPPGVYTLNNLRIKNGVRFIGSGYESTIIKQGAAGNYAFACTSDVTYGQLSSIELSGFKVVGATSAAVAAVIVNASGVYSVWKSKFDFVASSTYRALEVQGASANNIFRCDFKITSQDTSNTAVLINGGTYNNFDLFLTNCANGRALDFTGLVCSFTRAIGDGQLAFRGNATTINNAAVEEIYGTSITGEAAIVSTGFTETFINPIVNLSSASAAKVSFGYSPFDNTVFVNPKVLASTLANPFQCNNALKFTIVGPGQSTTTNKMDTLFTDNGGDTNKTLRRVSFVGDCSQWVTANRPGAGKAIQYAAPVNGANIEHLSNTDVLILEPAGAIAGITIQVPLAVDGQSTIVQSTQVITTITVVGSYPGGVDVTAWPTTIAANAPIRLVYRAANTKWYRC